MTKPIYRVLIIGWYELPPQYVLNAKSKRPAWFRSKESAEEFVKSWKKRIPQCNFEIVRV